MRHETGDAKGALDERQKDLTSHVSRLTPSRSLRFTLKAWPVIALATIGLCFLTQQVAGWFGIELPDQANIDIVRRYAGWNMTFAFLCLQIIVLLPAFEELYFRHFVYRRSLLPIGKRNLIYSLIPTGIFVALAILAILDPTKRSLIFSKFPHPPWLFYCVGACVVVIVDYLARTFLGRLIAKISPYAIMIASSAVFSAAHYIAQPWPDAAFVALFFFGLAQCWLYKKTDRLWCPILNHALFNLTNLILLFVIPQS